MRASANGIRGPSYKDLAAALERLPTLAAKLDLLFRTVTVPVDDAEHDRDVAAAGGAPVERRLRRHTYKEVAAAIGSTPEYVGYLVKGDRDNPGISYLRGIADFFGISVALLAEQNPGLPQETPGVAVTQDEVGHREVVATRVAMLLRFGTPTPRADQTGGAAAECCESDVAAAVHCEIDEIRRLREGRADELGVDTLREVSKFFGVPVTYLVGVDSATGRQVEEQLAMLRVLRDAGVLELALRAAEIADPAHKKTLSEVVESFLAVESTPAPNQDNPQE
ncbi:helix-turn-helix transcriptional regulator [Saccharothrix sp.]|uniref:helix-turn-helix domain-containing protein n=1 Tax=Saccharothrix sp. TaxID=1873460 RepID=UPI0028118DD9|nr:helix-turn-helix transcriptional regulator [Saccharothrix sp.]